MRHLPFDDSSSMLRVGGIGGAHTESSIGGVGGEGDTDAHVGIATRTSEGSQII